MICECDTKETRVFIEGTRLRPLCQKRETKEKETKRNETKQNKEKEEKCKFILSVETRFVEGFENVLNTTTVFLQDFRSTVFSQSVSSIICPSYNDPLLSRTL